MATQADVKPTIPQGGKTRDHEAKEAQVDRAYFRTKKIFVGGLPHNLTTEEFKNYFDKFGIITNAVILEENGRSRGFGFITFDSEEAVDDATRKTHYKLKDKSVEVKRADPNKEKKYKVIETYDCNDVGLDFGAIDCNNFCYYGLFCFSCLAPYRHEHQKGCLLYGQNSGGYYVAYPCGVPTKLWNEGDLQTYFCPQL